METADWIMTRTLSDHSLGENVDFSGHRTVFRSGRDLGKSPEHLETIFIEELELFKQELLKQKTRNKFF